MQLILSTVFAIALVVVLSGSCSSTQVRTGMAATKPHWPVADTMPDAARIRSPQGGRPMHGMTMPGTEEGGHGVAAGLD